MYRLETRIEINASAERVWSLLTDFPPVYPQWNPFIPSIEGKAVVGQPPTVFILASGLPWHAIPPHGARRRAPARASTELLIPGLFDGEHYFKLEPKSGTALVFHQGEIFSGLLAPLLNEALKREAQKP